MTKLNFSKDTMGAIERFMQEQEEAAKITPEMEQTRELSYELLKASAKYETLKESVAGFEAIDDPDVSVLQGLKEKVKTQVEEAQAALNTRVKELMAIGHQDDFIKIAKKTRFATSTKAISVVSFVSTAEEVKTRIGERINEQILLVDPETFAEQLANETNENIRRFVGMYQKRKTSSSILENWLEENILDDVARRRMIEHLDELKTKKLHTKGSIQKIIARWVEQSKLIKDVKSKQEYDALIQKTEQEIYPEITKGLKVMGENAVNPHQV